MNAMNYFDAVIGNRSSFVPAALAAAIKNLGSLFGIAIHTGLYCPETDEVVLYID